MNRRSIFPVQSARRGERTISNLLSRLVISLLVPLLAFSALVLWRFTEAQQQLAEKDSLVAATMLSKDVDRELRGIIAALTGLSTSPALKSRDLPAFYEQAHKVASLIGAPILLRDASSGRQLLNTRRPYGDALPVEASVVTETVVALRAPYVSDVVFGMVANRYLVAVAVPVLHNNEVQSVLMASVQPERIAALMADQSLPENWVIEVTDRKGVILARSRDVERFIGHPSPLFAASTGLEGSDRVIDADGSAILRGFHRTEQGWLVSTLIPVSYIDKPLRQSWLTFLMIGIAALALAMPLTLLYAGRIANSLREVANRASLLERGEVVPVLDTEVHEVARVGEILNAASLTLRERTRLLAESAARFKSAFDQAAVGFEQTDLDGRWLALNDRFCQMLGYTSEECRALTPEALTHPEDRLVEAPLIQRVLEGDLPSASIEKRYYKKGGGTLWVRSTTSLVRGQDGAPLYFVSVVEDTTSGQTALTLTARLAALVQASNDAIMSVTPEGLIDTWNPGAERLFGYSEVEILGQKAGILGTAENLGATNLQEARSFVERGLAGEAFRLDTCMKRKDATLLDVAVSVSPILAKDKTVAALSVTIEDIHQRREGERQLLFLNRELQHRVKNSLAVVQSIANQTMRSSSSAEQFRVAFQGRLQSLAVANDLLLQSAWTGSDLGTVIDQQMKPLLSNPALQLIKRGDSVTLPASLTIPLGLALHELGTNALKYGSLSASEGRVEIDWAVKDRELVLTWTETGGPPPAAAAHFGFGSTLIQRGIPGAVVEKRLEPSGLVCKITVVLTDPPKGEFSPIAASRA